MEGIRDANLFPLGSNYALVRADYTLVLVYILTLIYTSTSLDVSIRHLFPNITIFNCQIPHLGRIEMI